MSRDANRPCWCKSGKKWKRCHGPLAHLPFPRLDEIDHFFREMPSDRCIPGELKPGDCTQIIEAHSISLSRWLAPIAEHSHVLTIKGTLQQFQKHDHRHIPMKISMRKASCFRGVCKHHDSTLFQGLDNQTLVPTDDQLRQLWVRLYCLEVFHRDAGYERIDDCELLMRSYDYEGQKLVRQRADLMLKLSAQSTSTIDQEKELVTQILSGAAAPMCHREIPLGALYPLVAIGCKDIRNPIGGGHMQLCHGGALLGVAAVPDGDMTRLLLVWPPRHNSLILPYIETLDQLYASHGASFLLGYFYGSFQEVYCKPSWYDGLAALHQQTLHEIIGKSVVGQPWLDSATLIALAKIPFP